MFSSLFTQCKFGNEYIFTTALQKEKSNPDVYENSAITGFTFKICWNFGSVKGLFHCFIHEFYDQCKEL